MEVSFTSHGSNFRIHPVHGELTIHINPIGGLVPQIDGRLYVNGSLIHPQAGGGFTININPVGLLVPPQAGDVKKEHESENPKLPYPSLKMANPRVFFDMTVGGEPVGRIVMELFADTTPRTAENFRALCTGEKGMGKLGKPLHYKGSIIYHADPGYIIAGGDFSDGRKGSGGECIYDSRFFEDENFIRKHDRPGILSMANRGPDTNESQFMICLMVNPELDDVHVVFGQVVEGLDVVRNISMERLLLRPVVIADCGQIS
ncbi:unnamed protein product [Eruca vesicaria subsp. sativa]|uniref:Peptidyl-prolyl cis-trans isomerase n=1 Tax=Eruca vesicaria subsp. sativa TaxID=29727 RepID=A0ABC8KFF5_ERUVS|nr:unnamed protein product [Eruca vesicaria subsp. sativa]